MASQIVPLVVVVNVSWQSLVPRTRGQHLSCHQEILTHLEVLLHLLLQLQLWSSGQHKLILDITLFLRNPQPGPEGVTGQGCRQPAPGADGNVTSSRRGEAAQYSPLWPSLETQGDVNPLFNLKFCSKSRLVSKFPGLI